jgi:hypothetical protein
VVVEQIVAIKTIIAKESRYFYSEKAAKNKN